MPSPLAVLLSATLESQQTAGPAIIRTQHQARAVKRFTKTAPG